MKNNFLFGVADVLELLSIPLPKMDRNNKCTICPFCGHKKLSVDFAESRLHCYHCGEGWGMLKFYAALENVDTKEAYKLISESIGSDKTNIQKKIIEVHFDDDEKKYAPVSIEYRDAVYTAMLKMLTLSSFHNQKLLDRGLNEAEIMQNGYRSVPVMGFRSIADSLISIGFKLEGVPGFYREKGRWTLVSCDSGIFIPVRGLDGKIQGLQIRRDKEYSDNKSKKKYYWLSSNYMNSGAKACSWIHIVGKPQQVMYFTEGGLKADVINALSGRSVIAVPGVNNLQFLSGVLNCLYQNGTRVIVNAYDMDKMQKPEVKKALVKSNAIIQQCGMEYENIRWDARFKGLDDFLYARKMQTDYGKPINTFR